VKPSYTPILFKLAELGAHDRSVRASTGELAKALSISQQSASRLLVEMEKVGLIERQRQGRYQTVQLTEAGLESLAEIYSLLSRVFEPAKKDLMLTTTVFSGLGEGSYYMSLDGYRKQFRAKLGFDPFPGTLNLRIQGEDLGKRKMMEGFSPIEIEGFANEKRTYGGAYCYRALINEKLRGAVIVPIRAHYGEDVIEVIAPYQLRKQLHLKDGDAVGVKILS
jgi:riboflavin kinase, archaea type